MALIELIKLGQFTEKVELDSKVLTIGSKIGLSSVQLFGQIVTKFTCFEY